MHRIDAPNHNNNTFTEGNPANGTPATDVSAAWLNAVQEELCNVIEEAGLELEKPDNDQLLAALQALFAGAGHNHNSQYAAINHQHPYALVVDRKATGTDGGTFTSGAWQPRDLNTVLADGIGVAVAANRITLPAGAYRFSITAPVRAVDKHQARLYNITAGSVIAYGTSQDSWDNHGIAMVKGEFTVASPTIIEVQHQCQSTRNNSGFGNACNFGTPETYSMIEIWKI